MLEKAARNLLLNLMGLGLNIHTEGIWSECACFRDFWRATEGRLELLWGWTESWVTFSTTNEVTMEMEKIIIIKKTWKKALILRNWPQNWRRIMEWFQVPQTYVSNTFCPAFLLELFHLMCPSYQCFRIDLYSTGSNINISNSETTIELRNTFIILQVCNC